MTEDNRAEILERLSRPAATARQTYERVLASLRANVVGHDNGLRRLALAATASTAGRGRRVVLLGDGAAYVARTLGHLTGPSALHVSLSELSESGWAGANIGAYLDGRTIHRGQVVHLAGLEALAVRRGSYGGQASATADQREGKQAAVTQIMSGEPVRAGRDGEVSLATSHLMVIATGHLPDLPERPGADAWMEAGFTARLAELLAAATLIRLGPLSADHVWHILVDAVADACVEAEDLGYTIDADPGSLLRIAEAVVAGRGTITEARAWIRDIAERGVLHLLDEGAAPNAGVTWTIALDDVRIPPESRGRWVQ
jgi:hypothetical protein